MKHQAQTKKKHSPVALALAFVGIGLQGCGGGLGPEFFRLAQQLELFDSMVEVNTQVDILWVIDNSGSMAGEQAKLRQGFVSFANTYMQPTWDIRLAVITTDTFLAHPTFTNWTNSTIPNSAGYVSNYVNGTTSGAIVGRVNPLNNPNPAWAPSLFTWDAGISKWKIGAAGMKVKQLYPNYNSNYAKLLDVEPSTGKGNHDGMTAITCVERDYLGGSSTITSSRCDIRDNLARVTPAANTGTSHCITPVGAELPERECLNSGLNDTAHSGKSIINTYGQTTSNLINDFLVNATVGIYGNGYEQGINSVLQLINDNEAPSSTTKFFRQNSLRIIIFVSDEQDSSIVYPTNGPQSNPSSHFVSGAQCQVTIDGYTYTRYNCMNPSLTYPAVGAAIPISTVKSSLDTFFRTLDGAPAGDPNYFVTTITALTAATIQQSGDQGTRYLQLGQAVGNGSLELEIRDPDYSPLLDAIGQRIVQKKGIFTLSRLPTSQEEMIVRILHMDGSSDTIASSKYTIVGQTLTITDAATVLSFKVGDYIAVDYQPASTTQ